MAGLFIADKRLASELQHLPEFCVDGDAPPEQFDHAHTLLHEQAACDTHPDFLRKRGVDLSRS